MTTTPVLTRGRDYGREAHERAAAQLEQIQIAWEYEEFHGYYSDVDPDDPEVPQYPDDMAGPYDGCETCMVREVLHAAYPILEAGVIAHLDTEKIAHALCHSRLAGAVPWTSLTAAEQEQYRDDARAVVTALSAS